MLLVMKKTRVALITACLLGGILALVITRLNSTQSNVVAECSDVTVSPDDEVIIEHVKDSLNLSLSEPEEVTSEPEEEIEEPQEPKIDTVRSPDGRYYMVFPIGEEHVTSYDSEGERYDWSISEAGIYDSRSGKLKRKFKCDRYDWDPDNPPYTFVDNQDYVYQEFGEDVGSGWFVVANLNDPSKDFGFDFSEGAISVDGSCKYVAFHKHHGELIIQELPTGRKVRVGYDDDLDSDGYVRTLGYIDSIGDYVAYSFCSEERIIVYDAKTWTKLIDSKNIGSITIGDFNEKYTLICYYVYSEDRNDTFIAELYDKVTGKFFKKIPITWEQSLEFVSECMF